MTTKGAMRLAKKFPMLAGSFAGAVAMAMAFPTGGTSFMVGGAVLGGLAVGAATGAFTSVEPKTVLEKYYKVGNTRVYEKVELIGVMIEEGKVNPSYETTSPYTNNVKDSEYIWQKGKKPSKLELEVEKEYLEDLFRRRSTDPEKTQLFRDTYDARRLGFALEHFEPSYVTKMKADGKEITISLFKDITAPGNFIPHIIDQESGLTMKNRSVAKWMSKQKGINSLFTDKQIDRLSGSMSKSGDTDLFVKEVALKLNTNYRKRKLTIAQIDENIKALKRQRKLDKFDGKAVGVWDPEHIQQSIGDMLKRGGGYSNSKPGYFYSYLFEDGNVGYGITNVPKGRIKTHRDTLNDAGLDYMVNALYTGDGKEIRKFESMLKKKGKELVKQGVLKPTQLPGFATESLPDWFITYIDDEAKARGFKKVMPKNFGAEKLLSMMDEFVDLDKSTKDAVERWASTAYVDVRKAYKGKKNIMEANRKVYGELEAMFKRYKGDWSGKPLYRGFALDDKYYDTKKLDNIKVGDYWDTTAPASWSAAKSVAVGFTDNLEPNKIMLEVRKVTSDGYDIHKYSTVAFEKEVLMRPKAALKIVEIRDDYNGYKKYYVLEAQ